MTIEVITWDCPACKFDNTDEIDSDLGPFLSVTCGGCGKAFDRDAVNAQTETEITRKH